MSSWLSSKPAEPKTPKPDPNFNKDMGFTEEEAISLYIKSEINGNAKFFSSMTDRCFTDCILAFQSDQLSSLEELCVNRCVDKYLLTQAKISLVFQDQQNKINQPL
eukprot:TRINITY_DN810_c0_g1_i1.p1 TRINITY_DN810_c0_g1~~TRINITY_DN810_c0_g1_i1.p1  ORF type:complete len:106 (+),score=59.87 TRINITY_DN810_c0_g1_i1:27-344(+)